VVCLGSENNVSTVPRTQLSRMMTP
jgi:hypothetical protein